MSECFVLKELSIRQTVSSFIVQKCKKGLGKLSVENGEYSHDDTTNFVLTLSEPETQFTYNGNHFSYCIQKMGEPVTGKVHDRDSVVHEEHFLYGESSILLQNLIQKAIDGKIPDVDKKFSTYTWNARNEHWKRDGTIPERSFETIVLDKDVKKTLICDLEDFTSNETLEWYEKHCIPFKRGYLFHGKPGCGKTSTISAIATYLKRKVYKLNLVAPGLSDNGLMEAVNSVKKNSILVMEDIDSLFGVHREKNEVFCTTFSGLLNAIDGLGDSKGHIFIMTSNYPEKLDDALKRKGRCDLEIEFKACTQKDAENMFLNFYPDSIEDSKKFSSQMADYTYTPAQLQHHFIENRKKASKDSVKINHSMFNSSDKTDYTLMFA